MKKGGKKLVVPYYAQEKPYSCGPASLRMVFGYYGLKIDEREIRGFADTDKNGTTRQELIMAVKEYDFKALAKSNGTLDDLIMALDENLPVIIDRYMGAGHFSVLYGYDTTRGLYIHDPDNAHRHILSYDRFLEEWDYDNPPNWYLLCWPKKRIQKPR